MFPLAPVIDSAYVPGGVDEVVVIVKTADREFESVMSIDEGLKTPPVSADWPVTLNTT
jgi:hypothetical protein